MNASALLSVSHNAMRRITALIPALYVVYVQTADFSLDLGATVRIVGNGVSDVDGSYVRSVSIAGTGSLTMVRFSQLNESFNAIERVQSTHIAAVEVSFGTMNLKENSTLTFAGNVVNDIVGFSTSVQSLNLANSRVLQMDMGAVVTIADNAVSRVTSSVRYASIFIDAVNAPLTTVVLSGSSVWLVQGNSIADSVATADVGFIFDVTCVSMGPSNNAFSLSVTGLSVFSISLNTVSHVSAANVATVILTGRGSPPGVSLSSTTGAVMNISANACLWCNATYNVSAVRMSSVVAVRVESAGTIDFSDNKVMGATTHGAPSAPYAPTTIAAVVLDVFQPDTRPSVSIFGAGVFTARRNSVTSSAAGRGLVGGTPQAHTVCLVTAFAMVVGNLDVSPYAPGGSFVIKDNSLSNVNAMPANSTAFAVGLGALQPAWGKPLLSSRWAFRKDTSFGLSRNVGMNVTASSVYAVYCATDELDAAGGHAFLEHNRFERPSYGDTSAAVRLRATSFLAAQGDGIVSLSHNSVAYVEAARENSDGADPLHSAAVQVMAGLLYIQSSPFFRIANNSLTDASIGTAPGLPPSSAARQWAVVDVAVVDGISASANSSLTVANNCAHRITVDAKDLFPSFGFTGLEQCD